MKTGAPILVKLGGAVLEDAGLITRISEEISLLRALGVPVVLVHGGGPAINIELTRRGIRWEFVDGSRVTTPEMMDVIEMVLCGSVNRKIVRALSAAGVRAVGLSGADAATLFCSQADSRLGQVGRIEQVNAAFLRALMKVPGGATPVIAPIGVGQQGEAYNINADWAASRVAQALGLEKLVFLTDQDGILDADKKLISEIEVGGLEHLIQSGIVQGGMLAKTRTIIDALKGGVQDVRVLNARRPHGLTQALLGGEKIGTSCRLETAAYSWMPQKGALCV